MEFAWLANADRFAAAVFSRNGAMLGDARPAAKRYIFDSLAKLTHIGVPPMADLRRLPNLAALRAFEAAARHQNFSRAADEIHVTHGAISHQVRALEEEL